MTCLAGKHVIVTGGTQGIGPASHLAGRSLPKPSMNSYSYSNKPVLHRLVEPSQFTSWLFGTRLREAGLMGSMGKVASAYVNALMESFFGSMQIELLDRRAWSTKAELGTAVFEWIEAFYNPVRRHSGIGYHRSNQFEALHTSTLEAA